MVNLSATSRTNRSRSVVVSPDEQHGFAVKYWEIIADNLKRRGWSLGYVSAIDSNGRTMWIADAHRDDGKRFVVHADEKLAAFVELESAKVVFPDAVSTAVDTGTAVISRKSRSSMWTHCKPTQGHRGRPIFRNEARSGRVVECAIRIHDASSCSPWIWLRTD
jgi:hypothetical protein